MVELKKVAKLSTRLLTSARAIWLGGNPIAALTALWPTNPEGKYEISSDGIRIAFTNHGASVANLWVPDRHGRPLDVVLGLDHATQYPLRPTNPYLNGLVGRYQGLLTSAGGHGLTPDDGDDDAVRDGGPRGWGRQDWAIPSHTDDSITFVVFDKRLTGFPGVFVGCVTHTVTPHAWHVAYGITTILMPGGPVDLGQQVFFNLDGLQANGTRTVLRHKLRLPLSGLRFGMEGGDRVPTGDLLANREGGPFDFWSEAREVGSLIGPRRKGEEEARRGGVDETFVVAHKNPPPRGQGEKVEHPAAVLSSEHSGVTMEIYTDQEALRVHTWDDEKDGPLNLKASQGEGRVPTHGAISIVQGGWPDALNHPEWLHRKSLWGNMDIYGGYMSYRFKTNLTEQGQRRQDAKRDEL